MASADVRFGSKTSSIPAPLPKDRAKNQTHKGENAKSSNQRDENRREKKVFSTHQTGCRSRNLYEPAGNTAQTAGIGRSTTVSGIPHQQPGLELSKTSNLQSKASLAKEGKPIIISTKSHSPHLRTDSASSDRPDSSSRKQLDESSGVPTKNSALTTKHGRSGSRTIPKPILPSNRSTNQQKVSSNEQLSHAKHQTASGNRQANLSKHSDKSMAALSALQIDTSNSTEAFLHDYRQVQRELLRLHVLHSASGDIHSQWRESAQAHFRKRFKDLVERHTEIADIAFQTQELKNRTAVADWCRNIHGSEIGRRVRTLSRCLQDIYDDLDPSGKYNYAIVSFEAWYSRARKIQESRIVGSPDEIANLGYVEEIGAGWQNDVAALQRRLSTLTGELRTLGTASASSTLGQLLVLLQDLVIDMLAEVDCIRSIEWELMAQEKVWIEEQITSLSRRVHNEMKEARKTPSKSR
ncbi:MAG: hypothetical protein Q9201_001884 [Fulgogasparrea decipioides]